MGVVDPAKVRGIREDPRMAEQQFGNLQDRDIMKKIKNERHLYGRSVAHLPEITGPIHHNPEILDEPCLPAIGPPSVWSIADVH